jgi:hydrogenase-4 component E
MSVPLPPVPVTLSLPLPPAVASTLLVPAALATLLAGLLVLVSRSKAIAQVLGYLLVENGIFIFGLSLMRDMPLLMELGVLLDLFVAVFLMGIVVHHISREFDHLDTRELTALKD